MKRAIVFLVVALAIPTSVALAKGTPNHGKSNPRVMYVLTTSNPPGLGRLTKLGLTGSERVSSASFRVAVAPPDLDSNWFRSRTCGRG